MTTNGEELSTAEYDLVVVGSGAGGLGAAVAAASLGMTVVVLEKESRIGGTTAARSGGWIWVPGNRLAKAAGVRDSREQAMAYFRDRAGERFDQARVSAFLDNGSDMIDLVMRETQLRWEPQTDFPDYYPDAPGSVTGRSLFPISMDARRFLPRVMEILRPPSRSQTMLGMQVDGDDFSHFYLAGRDARAARTVAARVVRLVRDRLTRGQTMHLVGGNVLIAALADAALRRGVDIRTSSPALELIAEDGRVAGVVAPIDGHRTRILARRGVVLATGGFAHDAVRRAHAFPEGAHHTEMWAAMPEGNAGDGLRMAESVGGMYDDRMPMPIALTPFSRLESGEGVLEVFPVHAFRGVPGLISVTADGRRYGNEACNYHQFGINLLAATRGEPEPVAWLVADHASVRRYGLAHAYPKPAPIGHLVRSGYLQRADTLAELAQQTGIDAAGLQDTVRRFNENARRGVDPEFGRGSDEYDFIQGDPDHTPNPCLGPLDAPPYYATRVFVGALSTFAGLMTDAQARVLTTEGRPIDGLYAVGLDMSSIGGGDYIGGGINIGPAMTFGYVAAKHAADAAPVGRGA